MGFKISFQANGRIAQCAPDPAFPNGRDCDVSRGAAKAASLPYPAPSCGLHIIECEDCGYRMAVTAAGRPDDPKTIKVPCTGHSNAICNRADCGGAQPARWQVGMTIFSIEGQPIGGGMTSMLVCDGCREKTKAEGMFSEEDKIRVAHSFGQNGVPLPDFAKTVLSFNEIVDGKPVTMIDIQQAAEQRPAVPPSKLN